MNSPPASSIAGQRRGDLGHLHQRQDALVHPGAAAGAADDDQRQILLRGAFDQACQPLADDRAHAAHDEGRIGDAERHAAGADHAGAGQCRVGQPGPLLLGHEALGIRPSIGELQRVGRPQMLVHRLKGAVVEHLGDAFNRRNIKVVVALGTDVQPADDFFAIHRRGTTGALEPQPFGHTTFFLRLIQHRFTDPIAGHAGGTVFGRGDTGKPVRSWRMDTAGCGAGLGLRIDGGHGAEAHGWRGASGMKNKEIT